MIETHFIEKNKRMFLRVPRGNTNCCLQLRRVSKELALICPNWHFFRINFWHFSIESIQIERQEEKNVKQNWTQRKTEIKKVPVEAKLILLLSDPSHSKHIRTKVYIRYLLSAHVSIPALNIRIGDAFYHHRKGRENLNKYSVSLAIPKGR